MPEAASELATLESSAQLASLEYLLAAFFPRSRGARYEAAASAARQADVHEERELGTAAFHIAAFGHSRRQAALALICIRSAAKHRGAQFFARGQLVDPWRTERVLRCYLDSKGAADARAYCGAVVSESRLFGTASATPYLLPCRMLDMYAVRLSYAHPSSLEDQVQAAAVRQGCAGCPRFDAGQFRRLP